MSGRLKTANYTERALAKATIPSFCYIPRNLRPGVGALNVKITNAEIMDNHKRIAEADPLGWLIAVMNGQPIPHFKVSTTGDLELTYYIPDPHERRDAAKFLADRVTFKAKDSYKKSNSRHPEAENYDAMIERTQHE
jgi:hypothetical protein